MSTETLPIPKRSEVKTEDTWDLSPLFAGDPEWEQAFAEWTAKIPEYAQFQGTLGQSAEQLAACLKFDASMDRLGERLGSYASLKMSEDLGNTSYQAMMARFENACSRAGQAASFIRPEIMAIDDATMASFRATEVLAPYDLLLERVLRYKPHTLTQNEEKLLAMQSEMASTASNVFGQLNNVELDFGEVTDGEGRTRPLSHATFGAYLHSPDRTLRENTFHRYYKQFDAHKNTIAATLNGSIQGDIFRARARNYPSALEGALFADNVPQSVYDNLIGSVHRHLDAVYHYFEVRGRTLGLDEIHHYDTYVPILSDLEKRHSWDEAVAVVLKSLEPLGSDYQGVLEKGFHSRWCDRYENKGKRSGAFSSGSFDGPPYILMNFQEEVLDHVFTLTHEAGHSMHSYYSAGNQPFEYYNYTIFVAEVASTFNEQLLLRHLLENAADDRERAFLINREIDSLRGTLIRQTMFAEFEKIAHAAAEANEALTVDRFRSDYRKLLDQYFGPKFAIDDVLELECLRIPHFYRAFYVYKYATGIAAASALSQRVLGGGQAELDDYLNFLKGGCSKFPLDLLRDAGVDLEQPGPVDTALERFAALVNELDSLV